jgi:hypothetical protein
VLSGEKKEGRMKVARVRRNRQRFGERDVRDSQIAEEVRRNLTGRDRKVMEELTGRGRGAILTVIPTKWSGTAMAPLRWRSGVQARLGLERCMGLPKQCPDCGAENSYDHAVGECKYGGVKLRMHNEVVEDVERMAEEAGLWIPNKGVEPVVGKIGEEDAENRCDTIVRGLLTPQRDCWIDVQVIDTGSKSYLTETVEMTLKNGESKKVKKHGDRVGIAENADFRPIVCSVHGSMASKAKEFTYLCTERIAGKEGSKSPDFGRLLHLQRARFQAAVWNAVSLCLWGRHGKGRHAQKEALRLKEQAEGVVIPWEFVVADALSGGVE